MASSQSQPFYASSPPSSRRRKSRFTFKHFAQLGASSTTCPLRVIAHIDLDAFYAQCEMVRLGVAEDQPLAVQQWQGLIAINYPAREFGLSRHVTITEAQKACPQIILQHVATWREGDERWAYHDNAFANIATHKVSLDPYRLQSRKILAVIKETLPAPPLQKVEKASIDEVFLDLSAQVHSIMLDRYPELGGPAPYDDPTENLPAPPTTVLDWNADALVDLDENETEEDDPDWDDVAMLVGSEVVRTVRAAVRERLKYTCSAGIARNKMLAKLGSGHKKPNQQTIVRNRAIQHFLNDFKFTKIRNLGGKLGDDVVAMFNTDTVKDLLQVSMEQMKKLGDDTATWLYQTIRGEDHSEVNSRTQIKSMLSAKSFRPSINTMEAAVRWLRIFVADIYSRLVEEGVLENKRRPKTINLHHRQGGQTRSKQSPIPLGKQIDEGMLFELAKNLLAQVVVDGRAWPCANLSLSVGGFEDGPTGNKGIGGFLLRGDDAKAIQTAFKSESPGPEAERPAKRRRVSETRINKFFPKQEDSLDHASDADPGDFDGIPSAQREESVGMDADYETDAEPIDARSKAIDESDENKYTGQSDEKTETLSENVFVCQRCKRQLLLDQRDEHDDWHFARELQAQDHRPLSAASDGSHLPAAKGSKSSRGKARPAGHGTNGKGVEKGQSRLAFGR